MKNINWDKINIISKSILDSYTNNILAFFRHDGREHGKGLWRTYEGLWKASQFHQTTFKWSGNLCILNLANHLQDIRLLKSLHCSTCTNILEKRRKTRKTFFYIFIGQKIKPVRLAPVPTYSVCSSAPQGPELKWIAEGPDFNLHNPYYRQIVKIIIDHLCQQRVLVG